jgi:hypothetical protein
MEVLRRPAPLEGKVGPVLSDTDYGLHPREQQVV